MSGFLRFFLTKAYTPFDLTWILMAVVAAGGYGFIIGAAIYVLGAVVSLTMPQYERRPTPTQSRESGHGG